MNTVTRSLAALGLALSLAPLQAVPIAGDSFRISKARYASGDNNLVGQSPVTPGFQGAWLAAFGGSAAPNVDAANLAYTGVTSAGGSLFYDTNGRSGRLLATPYTNASAGTIYLSVRLQTPNFGAHYRGFELHNGGFDDGGNRVLQIVTGQPGAGALDSNYVVRLFNNTANFSADLGAGDTNVNLFVIRLDLSSTNDSDSISVWRNPTDFTVEANNAPNWTKTGFNFQFDRTSFARFGSGDLAADEVRLGTAWTDVVGPLDSDTDTMDDVWEQQYGLIIGVNDSADDDDASGADGLTNGQEFTQNTDPNNVDTDSDGVEDGDEVSGAANVWTGTVLGSAPGDPSCPTIQDSDADTIPDGVETSGSNGFVTNPALADTDGDTFPDATEIAGGSNPRSAASVPGSGLDPEVIGIEAFDMVDGSINGRVSGEGFDRDSSTERDPFTGHTFTSSDWDGNGSVAGGKLQTSNNSNAFREFNGPSEGGTLNTDEREGGYDINLVNNSETLLYFKVEMTRQCGATYSGLSFYNWSGAEELFFGVLGSNGEFGVEETGENNDASIGTAPDDLQTYTVVGCVDIENLEASFWLDPVLGGTQPAPDATLDLSISDFQTEANLSRIRLQSGGSGVVEWDKLCLGNTWESLSVGPRKSGGDPNLRDTFEAAWSITSGAANADADTATNQQEHDGNSNPTLPDTDGDTLNDNVELTGTTNPRLADTDGDAIDDNVELSGSANTAFGNAPTDPADCDSDNDGENDGFEIEIGSNPNNAGSNSTSLGIIIVNGVKDTNYGPAIAVQTVETQFGDNFSEWNAAYAKIKDGKLYLMLTGNLQDNFNKLEIFIDSSDAVTTNVLTTAGNDGSGTMNGLTFDTGFTPDYHLILRRGGSQFDLDFANLGSLTSNFYGNLFSGNGVGIGTTGTGVNASAIKVGFNNSNSAGVLGGTAAANQTAAQAVTTGLELCIDLCDLGAPDDEDIRISVMQNSNDHGFLSNQMLGGLIAPQDNLGGSVGTINMNNFAGNQFFTLNVPAGSAVCGTDGLAFTSIEQVGGDIVLNWTTSGSITGVDVYESSNLQVWSGPISTNDLDGTHTVVAAPPGTRFYIAVPTGDPVP